MAAQYAFHDHSGLVITKYLDNPYDGLLEQCNNDPVEIQLVYERHRSNRNAEQRLRLSSADFPGVAIDEILARLESPKDNPGYVDPRNCLVFWARPTTAVRELIAEVQRRLKKVLPNLWTMPSTSLHITALEVTHSLTAAEIDELVEVIRPHAEKIVDFPRVHRARLIRPLLSFDAQAFALSFLPAAGEAGTPSNGAYTYHHLRRDLYNEVEAAGISVASRYVLPSAHLTIGRYVTRSDLETTDSLDHEKIKTLLDTIDEINEYLQQKHWSLEWSVGQEVGFTCRKGTLWYGGGGETVYQGSGYE